jgi:hypothetical protein
MEILFGLKRDDEGLTVAQQLVEGPFNPGLKSNAYYSIGFTHKHMGKLEDAKRDFLKSIAIDFRKQQVVMTQLRQHGYYDGEVADNWNSKAENALDACLVDPECL